MKGTSIFVYKSLKPVLFLSFFCILFFIGCGESEPVKKPIPKTDTAVKPKPAKPKVKVPEFNANNAYDYIQKQVDFGPRVPGLESHKKCADWLKSELELFADKVYFQEAKVKAWDGKELPMYNIIGAFNPDAKKRIVLASHWDSRPWADAGTERVEEPIEAANDGASGVGVLLEMARVFKEFPIDIGVDIVFFDVEDYGKSEYRDSYCLGAQYWAKTPHVADYKANYGILLDMVGAGDALFLKEGNSMRYAPNIVEKVWNTAIELGYGSYFSNNRTRTEITDDHLYVNRIAKIPMIDIIHYTNEGNFGHFWHTHNDNMKVISKSTLKVVGHTMLTVLYTEDANYKK